MIARANRVCRRRNRGAALPDFDADTELDAIADSLDRVSIAMDLEETFGIDLPTVVVNRWRTVGDVEASLRAVLAQAGSAAA